MTATATHIINWKELATRRDAERSLKYVIEPATIYPGDNFTISIYDPEPYALISVYGGMSEKTVASTAESKSELINLTEKTEYPIANLMSLLATVPVVNADNRSIFLSGGSNLKPYIPVVDSQLKENFPFDKVYGSAKCDYTTYPAQIWRHGLMYAAGQIVLFAQNLNTLKYTNIPITIQEPTSASDATNGKFSVAIEGIPLTRSHFNIFGAYASFVVFPAGVNDVVATEGRVERLSGDYVFEAKGEQVKLDGSGVVKLSKSINRFTGSSGSFYNSLGASVGNINFAVSNGILSYPKGVYGTAFIDYEALGTRFDYFATRITEPTGGVTTKRGNIVATHEGQQAVYEIPEQTQSFIDNVEVLTVTFELASTSYGDYELPPNLDSGDRTYPSYPGIPESALMPKNGHSITEVGVESVFFNGYVFSSSEETIGAFVRLPFSSPAVALSTNADRKYKIIKKIPDWATAGDVDEINEYEVSLKTKYGIA